MSASLQRYTRKDPCPICEHHANDPAGDCHGILTDGGAWARCTRANGSDGAMLDEKCSPPAYVYRRQDDGSYRPWTVQPPMQSRIITKPRAEAHSASTGQPRVSKVEARAARPRPEGTRYFPYGPDQRVKRYDFTRDDGTPAKRIRPEYRNAAGVWIGVNGPEPIERIYCRDDLTARPDARVYLVEGEGCADALRNATATAITWRGGCGQVRQAIPQIVEAVRRRDVVLLPDADSKGRDAMRDIAMALRGVAKTVRIVNLYDDESGRDIEDWLYEGGTVDRLTELVDATPAYAPDATPRETWTPKITYLSDVQPERVQHLWPGRIPRGKVIVVDGDPGLGKTTVLLDIAARLTTGAAMPDGTVSDLDGPAGVVILTAEDGLADTIRPRLDAAGADVSRVVALECLVNGDEERSLSLTDLDAIEAAVRKVDAKLVIIDPLMAFLSSETNSYRDQDMRRILAPLARLAERLGCAIVVIRHLSKGGGANAVYRGGGSIGIIGAARCGLLVASDPDDASGARRIVAVTKSNLAAMPSALAYTLQAAANGTAYVAWEGATSHTAKQLLALPEEEGERGARDEAADILRQSLAAGPRPAKEITDVAAKAGISAKTLRTAREKLGVRVRREGGMAGEGHWMWELPGCEQANIQPPKMPADAPNMPNMPTKMNGHLRHLSDQSGILAARPNDPAPTSRPITDRDLPHIFPGYREAVSDD